MTPTDETPDPAPKPPRREETRRGKGANEEASHQAEKGTEDVAKASERPKGVKARRREAILERAAAILTRLPGASMAELASELKVSRATLYRYFPTRDALVRELALEAIDATDRATAHIGVGVATYHEAFRLMFEALAPLGDRYQFLSMEGRVSRDELVRREFERQNRSVYDMVEGAKRFGEIDPNVPTEWITALIDALIWTSWTALREGKSTAQEVADLAMRSLWQGIGKT